MLELDMYVICPCSMYTNMMFVFFGDVYVYSTWTYNQHVRPPSWLLLILLHQMYDTE